MTQNKNDLYRTMRGGVEFGIWEAKSEASDGSTQDMSINSWVWFEWRCI
jgi:hypothetical protein